jgi:hypothetical protein
MSSQAGDHLTATSYSSNCSLKTISEESELFYDWWFTTNHFVLATSPFRPTTRICIFQLKTSGYSPYVTSSLWRGWVCCLQLSLVLASAVILRSESHGTHDHILLSQIRKSPNLEGQVSVFISPGTGWPGYTGSTVFPFRRLLRLAGLLWRYLTPLCWPSLCNLSTDRTKHSASITPFLRVTQPLLGNVPLSGPQQICRRIIK